MESNGTNWVWVSGSWCRRLDWIGFENGRKGRKGISAQARKALSHDRAVQATAAVGPEDFE